MCPRQGGEGKCMLFMTTKPRVDRANQRRPCGECLRTALGQGRSPDQSRLRGLSSEPTLSLPVGGTRHSCLEGPLHCTGEGERQEPGSGPVACGHPRPAGETFWGGGRMGAVLKVGGRQVSEQSSGREGRASLSRTAPRPQHLFGFCKCFYC